MKNSITMIRPLIILFVFAFSAALAAEGYGQCDLKFEYEVLRDGDRSISLRGYNGIIEGATVKLFDLKEESVIEARKNVSLSVEWTHVFQNLPESAYIVIIEVDNCRYQLGETGIVIRSNNLEDE